MAGSMVMTFSVSLAVDKTQYDREWILGKNIEILRWLWKNISRGSWNKNLLEYDGPNIVITYEFEHEKDAVFFALKWQNNHEENIL